MGRRVAIIPGHPEPASRHFGQALADACAQAAHPAFLYPRWLGDMPAFFHRWLFGAHSPKNLRRNIPGFVGIGPIVESLIGLVEGGA